MRIDSLTTVVCVESLAKTHNFIKKEKEMKPGTKTLHQPNRQHSGSNWTIMTPVSPCSFIAISESYEGRDLHSLE